MLARRSSVGLDQDRHLADMAEATSPGGAQPSWMLFDAANGNDAAGLRRLLDGGADPDTQDSGGQSCLHYACDKGHAAVVEVLLRRGSAAG